MSELRTYIMVTVRPGNRPGVMAMLGPLGVQAVWPPIPGLVNALRRRLDPRVSAAYVNPSIEWPVFWSWGWWRW